VSTIRDAKKAHRLWAIPSALRPTCFRKTRPVPFEIRPISLPVPRHERYRSLIPCCWHACSTASDAALLARIQEMRAERQECEAAMLEKTEEPKYSPTLISQAVEGFTLAVQQFLQSWVYPGLTRVTFSEDDADLIISGRRRATEEMRASSHRKSATIPLWRGRAGLLRSHFDK
jgi:hypothetical protein